MTPSEFIIKYYARFADNVTGEISEADLREFVTDLAKFFVANSSPQAPAGVSWNEPPTVEIVDDLVIASDAEAGYGSESIAVPSGSKTIDYASSGLKRKDVFGCYFLEEPPYYDTLTGDEVALNAIAFSKPIPNNFLPVSYLDVTDGNISQPVTGNPVQRVKLPNGDVYVPDLNGLLTLVDFSKFKGVWVEGIKEADTYWLTTGGIWRTKQKFGSATAPTVNNAYWELVFAGGGTSYTDAQAIAAAKTNIGSGANNFAAGDLVPYQLPAVSYAATVVINCLNKIQPTALPITLTGNMDLSLSNLPATGVFAVDVVASGGTRTVTLPVGYRMANGSSRTLSLDTGKTATIVIKYNGTEYLAGFIK